MASNNSIFSLFRSRTSAPAQSYNGSYFAPFTNQSSAGELITSEQALSNPTVLTCINGISQGIAQLNCNIVEYVDGQVVKVDDPLIELLYEPNTLQSKYDFLAGLVVDLLQYGNAFLVVRRTTRGRIAGLLPANPEEMDVYLNSTGVPYYEHKTYGTLSDAEVIHIKDIAGHYAKGRSRVEMAKPIVGALVAANRLMGDTFAHGVSMNYVLEHDGSMDSETRRNMAEQLNAAFGPNSGRRGGVALIEGGRMNAIKGMTPADADLRQLRMQLINEVAAVFKIPASMVGTSGNVTYNNTSAQQSGFYRDTLVPIITNIEQAFTKKLLSSGRYFRFDVEALVKGDIASQASVATQLVQSGIWTPNEAREYLGSNPIEGGDELVAAPANPTGEDDGSETDTGNVGEREVREAN